MSKFWDNFWAIFFLLILADILWVHWQIHTAFDVLLIMAGVCNALFYTYKAILNYYSWY